jgi:hypothetical protein
MSLLSFFLTSVGVAGLFYAAWVASVFKGSRDQSETMKLYMYCASSFGLIMLGQLSSMKLKPAIVTAGKEPTFSERSGLHEFRRFSVRQGEYHKRAQAASKKRKNRG